MAPHLFVPPGTLTPAQRTAPPRSVARVCLNGHLVEAELPPSIATRVPTNRADPLAVETGPIRCPRCRAGTIVGCPGCGYPIPGRLAPLPYDVPHFCVVCGEYYPWTYRGEFYATLAEIIGGAPELAADRPARQAALTALERQRDGLANFGEIADLTDLLRRLGGSDWDLAAQILAVVLPPATAARLDLRGAFRH